MRHKTVEFNAERNVTLEVCAFNLAKQDAPESPFDQRRPAIIICPGGGYEFLSEREADPIAIAFQRFGFQCFILRYSIREHSTFPNPAVDAARSVRWVRANAEELGIDPERVTVLGFSAGGHVTALIGTKHDDPAVLEAERAEYDDLFEFSSRPDAIVPCYAVFSLDWKNEFEQSSIMATNTIDAVGPHVPPAFVWTTGEDELVPASQSLRFVNALAKAGVPFEYHHFAHGEHGLATSDPLSCGPEKPTPENAHTWIELCARWLRATFEGRNAG